MVVSIATFLLPVLVRRAARMYDTPFRLYICHRVGARGVPTISAGWGTLLLSLSTFSSLSPLLRLPRGLRIGGRRRKRIARARYQDKRDINVIDKYALEIVVVVK